MLTETGKVGAQRDRKVLTDLWEGLSSVLSENPRPEWAALAAAIPLAVHANGWFTEGEVRCALERWTAALAPDEIGRWMDGLGERAETGSAFNVGIVMAGNIPFVGMHDLICGVVSGHRIQL